MVHNESEEGLEERRGDGYVIDDDDRQWDKVNKMNVSNIEDENDQSAEG